MSTYLEKVEKMQDLNLKLTRPIKKMRANTGMVHNAQLQIMRKNLEIVRRYVSQLDKITTLFYTDIE